MFSDLNKRLLPIVFLLPIAGCASIVDGTNQTLSVQTIAAGHNIADAQCQLENGKGTWFVKTPGTVTVHRAYGALNLKCRKTGYQPGIATVASATKGMAFGNILFGGVIGAGVDMSDGAAYSYPSLITVPLGQDVANAAITAEPAPAATAPKSAQPVD